MDLISQFDCFITDLMRKKTNGPTEEGRQIISLLLVGFLFIYYFYSVAGLGSSLPC